jgi:hypothetical protein
MFLMKQIYSMKIAMVATFIFTLFIFDATDAKSSCAFGSTRDTIVVVDSTTGCSWTIEFCWTCNHITPSQPLKIEDVYFVADSTDTLCNNAVPDPEFIENAIVDFVASQGGCGGPPCDGKIEPLGGTLEMPMCQKWVNKPYFNHQPPFQFVRSITYMESCVTDLVCIKAFTFCVDFGPPTHLRIVYTEADIVGDENECSEEEPDRPPSGMTYMQPWQTNCYQAFPCEIP